MKKKSFSNGRILIVFLSIFTISIISGSASDPGNGCPPETGGYATTGIRSGPDCDFIRTEHGFNWSINGSVSWVATVIANFGGTFEAADKEITYTGKEYKCTGALYGPLCWVCNCYYNGPSEEPIAN